MVNRNSYIFDILYIYKFHFYSKSTYIFYYKIIDFFKKGIIHNANIIPYFFLIQKVKKCIFSISFFLNFVNNK